MESLGAAQLFLAEPSTNFSDFSDQGKEGRPQFLNPTKGALSKIDECKSPKSPLRPPSPYNDTKKILCDDRRI